MAAVENEQPKIEIVEASIGYVWNGARMFPASGWLSHADGAQEGSVCCYVSLTPQSPQENVFWIELIL